MPSPRSPSPSSSMSPSSSSSSSSSVSSAALGREQARAGAAFGWRAMGHGYAAWRAAHAGFFETAMQQQAVHPMLSTQRRACGGWQRAGNAGRAGTAGHPPSSDVRPSSGSDSSSSCAAITPSGSASRLYSRTSSSCSGAGPGEAVRRGPCSCAAPGLCCPWAHLPCDLGLLIDDQRHLVRLGGQLLESWGREAGNHEEGAHERALLKAWRRKGVAN